MLRCTSQRLIDVDQCSLAARMLGWAMDLTAIYGVFCAPGTLTPLGAGPLLGLFLAGLGGSVLHCAPMCGPFVLGQVSARMARTPAARLCEMRRIGAGMLLPYHLGRLSTYALLGAMAGGIGAGLGQLPWFGLLSGVLLVLAAALFMAHATRRLFPAVARVLPGLDPAPPGLVRGVSGLIGGLRLGNGFTLGVLLGFLPCGLLYAALAAAAAGQSAVGGAMAMAAFGLGTVPALLGVGILGQGAWQLTRRPALARLSPAVLVLNAMVLAALAWQRFLA